MPAVKISIPPMRYIATTPSGTVLWSVSLPAGSGAELTGMGPGLEGSVRQMLPVCYLGQAMVAGGRR